MGKKMRELLDIIAENRTRRAIALFLAVVVTFTTTYTLVLPAITLEKETAETMSGVSMGGNEQTGDTAASSEEEASGESEPDGSGADTVAYDAEAKNQDGETETLVHVEADAGAFPEGTTMEASVVTDQAVLDSITASAEGEVVAVHAVDLTFSDETGETVQPAEGSQLSVTLSPGEGESSAPQEENAAGIPEQTEETGEADVSPDQATETTVVQFTEDSGAETLEANEDVAFQVEPETDLDQDNAVSFDLSGRSTEQDTQTYAIVETVPESGDKENSLTEETEEGDSDVSGDAGAAEEAPAAGETETPRDAASGLPAEETGAVADGVETAPEGQETFPEEAEEAVLTVWDDSCLVTMNYGPEAQIPRGSSLKVEEILIEDKAYDTHLEETRKALNEAAQTEAAEEDGVYAGPAAEEPQFFGARSLMADPDAFDRGQLEAASAPEPEIVYARFFDITILDAEGAEVTPAAPVKVSIELLDADRDEETIQAADTARVIHFGGEETEVVEAEAIEDAVAGVTFDALGFSVYGVVYTVELYTQILTGSGDRYDVTVSYGQDAQIPEGTELRVREITEEDAEYAGIRARIGDRTVGADEQIPSHPMLLDISLWYEGREIEPAEGSDVRVRIRLADEAAKGMYTGEDSPVLVNDAPVAGEQAEMAKQVQVLHLTKDDQIDAMETKDAFAENAAVSSFTTDSFSNWLVYLDEDLTDINVKTGDSLTLRPYTEWVWKSTDEPAAYQGGQWTFPSSSWDTWTGWENNVQYTYYKHKTNGSQFRSFVKEDTQLHETYTVVTSMSLQEGVFDLQTNKGKTIHVHVTQGTSGKPGTVNGISGLTVNLFDYDVPMTNGDYDFTKSGNLDKRSNVASSPDNTSGNINNGHDLKILGYGGSNVGANDTWFWINNYTNEYASQGIVKDDLYEYPAGHPEDGYPSLVPGKNGQERDNPSLKYLFDPTSHNSNVYAFAGADGLFQKDNQGYYYYNSNSNYAEYDRGSNRFVLYEHTYSQNTGGSNGANAKPIGFFPFHEYDTSETQPEMNFNTNLNHHFGMSMTVDFEIPKDRQMEDKNGNKHDIIYEFSGDDDLWVFVDGKLALDIGGIHQPVTGSINFTTGVIKVHGVTDETMTFGVGAHTLKMFYIERGGCDSNLSVRFNLPLTKGKAGIDVVKKSMTDDASDPDTALSGAVFGLWENADCTGEPYMIATSDGSGHLDFDDIPIRGDEQIYYLKEMAPPPGYLLNTTVYEAVAVNDGSGNYSFSIRENDTEIEKMTQQPQWPIIRDGRAEDISLSVTKQWQNADGTEMTTDTPSNPVTFKLKRYYNYVEGSLAPANSTIKVYRVDSNWSNPRLMDTKELAGNSTASVNWTYSQYLWDGYKNWQYRVGNGTTQTKAENSPASISLAAGATTDVYIFDGNLGTQYEQYGVENITVTGTAPTSGGGNFSTGQGEDTEYQGPTLTLPTSGGAWTDSFNDLVQMEQKGNRTYYYEYYIVEDPVPSGFEAVYLDSSGNPVADPAGLKTNQSGTQTVANRKLLDVPIEKEWADYIGDDYTWTATFQLEQMEEKVNESDPDAADALTSFTAVDGRTLTVSKGDAAPSFDGLPMYRVHSNGTVYRIIYSVSETAYEVRQGSTVVAKWSKDGGLVEGSQYTPQFEQDAGENGADIGDYEIIVVNSLENLTVDRAIELGVQKTWPADSGVAARDDAYARFVLKRQVHEEFRDYTGTGESTEWVDITLDTWGNGTKLQKLRVPQGTQLHIVGSIKGETNANKIAFSQSTGGAAIELIQDNSQSQDKALFDITFTADQTKTVSLTQGDNYVVGGRDGFFLSDTYSGTTVTKEDTGFAVEFTLDKAGGWREHFDYLPQIVVDGDDPTAAAQTIRVYSYYLEEVDCNPEGYSPEFKPEGQTYLLGDANNAIDNSENITANNTVDFTELTVVKSWDDQGKDHSGDTATYTIYRIPFGTVPDPENPGQTMEIDFGPEVVTDASVPSMSGFTGNLRASNDPAWTETVTGLPNSGYRTHEGSTIPVQYTYYVMEGHFEGYSPIITERETGTHVFDLKNEPHNPLDTTTEIGIEKHWQDKDGNPAQDAHDGDSITILLTQKKYRLDLYPVKIRLIDGNGTISQYSETIYVPAGEKLYFMPRSESNGHTVYGQGVDNAGPKTGKSQDPFYLNDAAGGKVVTFTLQKTGDTWADSMSGEHWTFTRYDESASGHESIVLESQLPSLITNAAPVGDPIPREYTMKLNDQGTGTVILPHTDSIGTGEGAENGKWSGTIRDLPLVEKGSDDEFFYYFTYEVSEIKIGEDTVTVDPTAANTGETPQYLVNWSGSDDSWTITNRQKPSIPVILKKVKMDDLNQTNPAPLPGAAFQLFRYTDETYQSKDTSWSSEVVDDPNGTGVFRFEGLLEGYYEIDEAVVPDGYVKDTTPPRFHVKPDLSIELIDAPETLRLDDTQQTLTIYVGNVPGAVLPSAGGPGEEMFKILGVVLIAGAGALLIRRRSAA